MDQFAWSFTTTDVLSLTDDHGGDANNAETLQSAVDDTAPKAFESKENDDATNESQHGSASVDEKESTEKVENESKTADPNASDQLGAAAQPTEAVSEES